MSFYNPRESRPMKRTPSGEVYYFRFDDCEFDLVLRTGDGQDDQSSTIRPHDNGFSHSTNQSPEWLSSQWVILDEIVSPQIALAILKQMKDAYRRGRFEGRRATQHEIKSALDIK